MSAAFLDSRQMKSGRAAGRSESMRENQGYVNFVASAPDGSHAVLHDRGAYPSISSRSSISPETFFKAG
jgi:hypothetical protein